MQKILRAAVPVALAAIAAACAGQAPHGAMSSSASAPTTTAPAVQQLGHVAQKQISPWTIIGFLRGRGLPAPNALDVTDQACHNPQCRQSVITDTVQVTSFASASAARAYAHPRGLRVVDDIVVTFAPVLNPTEREQLWSAVTEAVR
jgi:hypothetical protein